MLNKIKKIVLSELSKKESIEIIESSGFVEINIATDDMFVFNKTNCDDCKNYVNGCCCKNYCSTQSFSKDSDIDYLCLNFCEELQYQYGFNG